MTPSTVDEAKKLLERPVFGNEEHIKAVRLLVAEEEAARLRKNLKGNKNKVECWCCGGTGEIQCDVGCHHTCPTCDGEGRLALTPTILRDLQLGQLRDIAEKLS